jgi:hypothetical protein
MVASRKQIEFERQIDLSLIRQFKKSGNIDNMKEVYEKYVPLIYGVAYRITQNRHKAQMAIIVVFERLTVEAIKSEIENIREWIYNEVKNFCKTS